MASVRKRKMARSSVKKASRKHKDRRRKVNITSNPIIAKNWDYSLTLAQNYELLGLRSKLQSPAGGREAKLDKVVSKEPVTSSTFMESDDEFGPESKTTDSEEEEDVLDEESILQGEARIIRDSEGTVIKVLYGKKKGSATELAADNGSDSPAETNTVRELKAFASRPCVKKERVPSEREELWLKALYEKHGDNYKKMFFDKKLNINQQSEGDLKRRLERWKTRHAIV
ncbi:LADA_0E13300g1_1 [Lachancea dasiensis]|uniref:Nucleolar protein 16 n=1 Tax=Lachancea dasiensis TaxID=1072105 RepID=A0A1G4JFE3_9SACH|nr:LADA_0E13300g1_1 [Lachancea dasiensis]